MTLPVIAEINATEKPQERSGTVGVKNNLPRAMRALLTMQRIFGGIGGGISGRIHILPAGHAVG